VTANWTSKSLKEVALVGAGNSAPQDDALFVGGEFPFFRTSDVGRIHIGSLYDAEDHLNEKGTERLTLYPAGTILLPKSGASTYLDHRIMLGRPGYVSSHLATVQARDGVIETKFLFYFLLTVEARSLSVDSNYPTLSLGQLNNIQVSFPPLPEQRRIVAILDAAFDAIATATANAEKNLANAQKFFADYLNSIFESECSGEKSFNEFCEISSRLVDPRKPDFLDLPHIGAGNIVSVKGNLTDVQTAREEGLISGKFLFDSSMVLYSKIRPYLVKVCRPDFSGICSADIYPLSPIDGEITRDFLYYLLVSKRFTDYAIAGSARAGMPKVNREHLFQYKCRVPSVAEQEQIAAKLDTLSEHCGALERVYRQKLIALTELKQSILTKALNGELTASDTTNVVPFPRSIPNITAIDLHAGVLAIAFQRHLDRDKHGTFQHVKAEKIAHMIEAFAGIDLGRKPVKDAAGPNDFPHLHRVQHRADRANFFSFKPGSSGYQFDKKNGFDRLVERTRTALGSDLAAVEKIIGVMVPMDFRQAEIFATVYAAWNNLLLDGRELSDEAIVRAARDEWHPEKLKIPVSRFSDAITWMRSNGYVPTGIGKKVLERPAA
jgi:restriction endonuclease S subunit